MRKHGWHGWTGEETAAWRAWRTRIIYQTNLATSYAAGRLAQLKEAGFKYWVYRHSGSENPRLQHLAWNGLTLPADHPFWQTHYPPNGWGCKCRVVGADGPKSAERLGGKPGYTKPPAGWDTIDEKTGEPVGVDNGWGYMPGGTVIDTVRALKDKLNKLPPEPSVALIQSWLKSETFARWFEQPSGGWPLARLPDADAQALGAKEGVRVAMMSAETAAKQRAVHPEIAPEEYALAQDVIDRPTHKVNDGGRGLIYVREVAEEMTGGYVLVVKATQTGKALWVTSYRRGCLERKRNGMLKSVACSRRKGSEAAPDRPRGADVVAPLPTTRALRPRRVNIPRQPSASGAPSASAGRFCRQPL